VSLAWAGFGDVLAVDMSRALDVYYDRAPILDATISTRTGTSRKQVTTAFVKLDFEGGNWRGNVGMQAVVQDQQATGVVINGTEPGAPIDPICVTKGADYLDILPSLNLIYDLAAVTGFASPPRAPWRGRAWTR
jgi:iron complex outermembrane recepter protein